MNIIKRIKVENIKGKQVFEITFSNFVANQPNIVLQQHSNMRNPEK